MNHRKLLGCLLLPCLISTACIARAQEKDSAPAAHPLEPKPVQVLSGRPDSAPSTNESAAASKLLAPPFISEIAGISFQPPAGWKKSEKPADDEIAGFANNKNWILKVTRANLEHAVPLVGIPAQGNLPAKAGMLDLVIENFKKTAPDTEILRNEVVNLDNHYVGLVVARYTLNGQPWLRQQAMLQATDGQDRGGALGEESGRLYYVLNLITPAGNADDDQLAANIFSAVVDTVKLLDRTKIRQDQVDRLYRTRTLLTYWDRNRFEKIVVPRQYFRLVKHGKDIGYTFSEELLENPNLAGVSAPGPIAYERTHLDEADAQGHERRTDAGLFKYMSFDRSRERWTRSVVLQTKTEQGKPFETYGTEFGETVRQMRRVFAKEKDGGVIDPSDPKAPPAKMEEFHSLDVIFAGKDQNAAPIHQDLPTFYIPQAAWHFLPRLVVDHKAFPMARSYMFAVYNSEKHQVMSLYVDKSAEQDITFAGNKFDGVTVTERLGLGGPAVVHYLTSNGIYLGSDEKDQHVITLASDEKEILQRWPKANLTRPEPLQPPGRNTDGATSQGGAQLQPDASNRRLPPAIR